MKDKGLERVILSVAKTAIPIKELHQSVEKITGVDGKTEGKRFPLWP